MTGYIPAKTLEMVGGNLSEAKETFFKSLASILGSLTNTILVMLFIFLFFRNQYETLVGQNILKVIGLTILTNGVPEAIIAGIVCPAVSSAMSHIDKLL